MYDFVIVAGIVIVATLIFCAMALYANGLRKENKDLWNLVDDLDG
jgi:hypothetical protein